MPPLTSARRGRPPGSKNKVKTKNKEKNVKSVFSELPWDETLIKGAEHLWERADEHNRKYWASEARRKRYTPAQIVLLFVILSFGISRESSDKFEKYLVRPLT